MAFKSVSSGEIPEFFVNGVKIFRGVPSSFSQLDEAYRECFWQISLSAFLPHESRVSQGEN